MTTTAGPPAYFPPGTFAGATPATTKHPTTGAPLGLYVAGALVVIGLADTRAAPVVGMFLLAAVLYNANHLLRRNTT